MNLLIDLLNFKKARVNQLLNEFADLRAKNVKHLKSFTISSINLENRAIHPQLGIVTLEQLISTWVVQDLSHNNQTSRTKAKQYANYVGPWKEYLGILNR